MDGLAKDAANRGVAIDVAIQLFISVERLLHLAKPFAFPLQPLP